MRAAGRAANAARAARAAGAEAAEASAAAARQAGRQVTVLGRVRAYEPLADRLGANSFRVHPDVWEKMPLVEK